MFRQVDGIDLAACDAGAQFERCHPMPCSVVHTGTVAGNKVLDNGAYDADFISVANPFDIETEILIAGGGMIGLTQALAFASAGLSVVVVDRQPQEVLLDAGQDGRVSSIAYGSHAVFDQLGAWVQMAPFAEPILDIRVSDGHMPFFLHFDHRDVGDRPFGFMLENRRIRLALYDAVAAAPGVTLLAPEELQDIERSQSRATATLGDGRRIRADLLVAADGRGSELRQQAGIRQLAWRYDQTAIVCTVRHEEPHHGVAKEHFLPAGPFALLPMQGNRSSLVWTEKPDHAEAMLALTDEDFDAEIQARAGDHWGAIHCDSRRWAYPLGLANSERYIDQRLALVGDAAHAMHPIAGQGLNLGLRDVAALAEVAVDAARLGLDFGDPQTLERYQQWRRFDALTMLVMTDGLNRLFSTDSSPIRLLRGLGLGAVERVSPLKRFFERHAAAMSGDLPRLVQGQAL
jgi:2-octaprenyl-6-methoxyphenol hydroxylase